MTSQRLLPHKFKPIGWIVAIPFFAFGVFIMLSGFEFEFSWLKMNWKEVGFLDSDNLTDEFVAVILMIGLVFIAFSREKIEDEFVAKMRLDAWLWAALGYCIIVIFGILLLYDEAFFYFMVINMYTPLILFILKFHLKLRKAKISA